MIAPHADIELVLGPDEMAEPGALAARVARATGRPADDPPAFHLVHRAIDARAGRVVFRLRVALGPEPERLGEPLPRDVCGPPVIVVGDGPAGLFCAYELARAGRASVVLDRGKPVQPRRHDLAALHRRGYVDPESNYCFGEGGAGTYSDGKLYTRADKRGPVRDVLETLALHGAPRSVLVEARPHVGSNKLPRVVTALRERLQAHGVQFRFGARVVGLVTSGGSAAERRVLGVRLAGGETVEGVAVVLATGHSARDVFELLREHGAPLEPKGFAIGVRVEHPQPLIDRLRWGRHAGHRALPAASYALTATVEGRGVYSFCMCPGGFVIPAATEPDGVVLNGMSLSRRDSPYANAGLVVAIEPEDLARAGYRGPLAGVELQRRLERAAFEAGGGALRAPASRLTDLVAGRASSTVPASSYRPGLRATDVCEVLDAGGLRLSERLREAVRRFERTMPGFLTAEAVVLAVESRTSSPVRVPRDPTSLQCPGLAGLYPCGEGAGWAGGIMSAALDGIRVARAIVRALGPAP
ncbi:MAG: FAD-binding protein [Myxococcota bacterium]|nr:FAD-binding protein [Myxococcota bacterium]